MIFLTDFFHIFSFKTRPHMDVSVPEAVGFSNSWEGKAGVGRELNPNIRKHPEEGSDDDNSSDEGTEYEDGETPPKRMKLDNPEFDDDDMEEPGYNEHDDKGEGEDDDEDVDDEKAKTDDGDEHSDAAALQIKQSKRKPSKSRIKRILPHDKPPTLTPDPPLPPVVPGLDATPNTSSGSLPSMDSLVMMGGLAGVVGQPPMMISPSDSYSMQMPGGQQRTPGAYRWVTK